MSQSHHRARRAFRGVMPGGFIPNYSHLLIKDEDAVNEARETVKRDGGLDAEIRAARPHFATTNQNDLLGVSFRTFDSSFFLRNDGLLVDLKETTCTKVHDAIAAYLESHDHEYAQANKMMLTGHPKLFAAACDNSFKYGNEARLIKSALGVLHDHLDREKRTGLADSDDNALKTGENLTALPVIKPA